MDLLIKNKGEILFSGLTKPIQVKGEILDKRLEELLKKEFPHVNSLILEELFMKMESMGIINVFRVSKNKKMIVFNKRTKAIREGLTTDLI